MKDREIRRITKSPHARTAMWVTRGCLWLERTFPRTRKLGTRSFLTRDCHFLSRVGRSFSNFQHQISKAATTTSMAVSVLGKRSRKVFDEDGMLENLVTDCCKLILTRRLLRCTLHYSDHEKTHATLCTSDIRRRMLTEEFGEVRGSYKVVRECNNRTNETFRQNS